MTYLRVVMQVFACPGNDIGRSVGCMLTLPFAAVWTGQGDWRGCCGVGESWHLRPAATGRELLWQRLLHAAALRAATTRSSAAALSCARPAQSLAWLAVPVSGRAGGDIRASHAGNVRHRVRSCSPAVRSADCQQCKQQISRDQPRQQLQLSAGSSQHRRASSTRQTRSCWERERESSAACWAVM
jgi:hypothetical protein